MSIKIDLQKLKAKMAEAGYVVSKEEGIVASDLASWVEFAVRKLGIARDKAHSALAFTHLIPREFLLEVELVLEDVVLVPKEGEKADTTVTPDTVTPVIDPTYPSHPINVEPAVASEPVVVADAAPAVETPVAETPVESTPEAAKE